MAGIFSARPPSAGSGSNTSRKVVVQHRSDMLLEEQIRNVKNVQESLEQALVEVEAARSQQDVAFHQNTAKELEQRLKGMMLVVKIVHKVNNELVYARLDLQKALKEGSHANISKARKRIGWLEDRVDNLLGKRRQRSFHTGCKTSDSERFQNESDGFSGGFSEIGSPESPKRSLAAGSCDRKDQGSNSDASYNIQLDHHGLDLLSRGESIEEEEGGLLESSIDSNWSYSGKERHPDSSEDVSPPKDIPFSEVDPESVEHSVQRSGILLRETQDSRKSRSSRVTMKTSSGEFNEDRQIANEMKKIEDNQEMSDYWESERRCYDYNEYVHLLLQLDPLSYHQMGLAVPATFVDQVKRPVELPWKPRRSGSELTDIHKTALNDLSADMNKMFDKVRDASLLSVNPTDLGDLKRPTLGTESSRISIMNRQKGIRMKLIAKCTKMFGFVIGVLVLLLDTLSRETPVQTLEEKPSLANHGLTRPDSNATITFPPLDKDRLGSSLSNRLVYYPNPLPYPENLPVSRTVESLRVPLYRLSNLKTRIVQPFFRGTQKTSANPLLISKLTEPTASEKNFRKMLEEEDVNSVAETQPEKKKKSIKAAMLMAKTMIKFQDFQNFQNNFSFSLTEDSCVRWEDVKPKTGALAHSGLKWERVKSIVHNSLVSPNADERVDAARHLGALQCGDTMVVYALRERLRHDDNERVIYEVTKSLITIGCWDEEILIQIVHYLIEGNRDIKDDLLKSMITSKNVQYIDKRLATFKELSRILSLLCRADDPNDPISFHSAIALGKMCVADENAKNKLSRMLEESTDVHQRAETLEIMVRQMNVHHRPVIEAVLKQLQRSPVWKHRKAAARQLIHLGSKWVLGSGEADKVYEILERRLWDDPNKVVRHEVAKVLAALGLFASACEKVEKKMEDPHEDIRIQAVVSVGTLGMKNERTLRALLEMLDLDPSPLVRLMIIRTFGVLKTSDRRVIRALKVRVGGEQRMSMEASRILEQIGSLPRPSSKMGSRAGSKGMLSKGNTQLTV
ncbi:hypothetical protein CAPTEDRAFT_190566 [Capitella teleta]|uniref:Uncharacterized protein n=1 Tax=Capitella teleta TaxID=283909 RepID=R7TUY8_CAPTE|nr:hypothetical protein CAPTEDRAFT_190566 [Capitella teleta]|eukprot:ELT97382.1 hypothetical protein CAPTEDRAFT_190566 [Capitella teleta]